jgi:hypothetical protein
MSTPTDTIPEAPTAPDRDLKGVVLPRLVRLRAGSVWLRFEPPCLCDCGGEVEVKDWETRTETRYEASCNKCYSCDPNGWGSQREIIANSPGYFQKAND